MGKEGEGIRHQTSCDREIGRSDNWSPDFVLERGIEDTIIRNKAHMRRSALILLAAILLPSLVLAWLAMRSARDQQVILEHQQVIIAQDVTDALAKNVQSQLDQARATFISQTQSLLQASSSARDLAGDFNQQLRRKWDLAEVG